MSATVDWAVMVEDARQQLDVELDAYRHRPTRHRRLAIAEARRALREMEQREAADPTPGFFVAALRGLIARVAP